MATATTTLWDDQVYTRTDLARLPAPVSKKVNFSKVAWTSTALATGETLSLMALPPGTIPRPDLSRIIMGTDITTSSLTVEVGSEENPDGWMDAVDCAAIGVKEACSGTIPAWLAKTELAADTGRRYVEIYATFTIGASTLDVGEAVYFILAWESPG